MIPFAALGIVAKVVGFVANPMKILEGLFHFFFETKTGRVIGILLICVVALLVAYHKGKTHERAVLKTEIVEVAKKAATIEFKKSETVRVDLAKLQAATATKDAELADLRRQLETKADASPTANTVCLPADSVKRLREYRDRSLRP